MITAIQWTGKNDASVIRFGTKGRGGPYELHFVRYNAFRADILNLQSKEGYKDIHVGDWVIRKGPGDYVVRKSKPK